jgi:hypothetical protein
MKRQRDQTISYNEYQTLSLYNEHHVGNEKYAPLSMLQERVIESLKSELDDCLDMKHYDQLRYRLEYLMQDLLRQRQREMEQAYLKMPSDLNLSVLKEKYITTEMRRLKMKFRDDLTNDLWIRILFRCTDGAKTDVGGETVRFVCLGLRTVSKQFKKVIDGSEEIWRNLLFHSHIRGAYSDLIDIQRISSIEIGDAKSIVCLDAACAFSRQKMLQFVKSEKLGRPYLSDYNRGFLIHCTLLPRTANAIGCTKENKNLYSERRRMVIYWSKRLFNFLYNIHILPDYTELYKQSEGGRVC